MPRFSVVMPAFNASACLSGALQSILDQRQPVDEVIVVDDGSADDTAAVAEAWADRLPMVVLRNGKNRGIGDSLRRGVEAARSDWVLRLDADDRWLPGHVQALAGLAAQPGVCLVTAPARMVDEQGQPLGFTTPTTDALVRRQLLWDNPLIHSATGFSKAAYLAAGGYRQGVRWEDYDLWIRLLAAGTLGAAQAPGIDYTVSPNSLSRTKRAISMGARWECQRRAIARYGARYPLATLKAVLVGGTRVLLARLF